MFRYMSDLEREAWFWSRLELKDECFVWTGGQKSYGYGNTSYKSKPFATHRLAYLYTFGELPKGLVLDHLCRNKLCANPEHLEPVTNRENILRGFIDRGTCRNGHVRTPENTLRWRNKKTIGGYTNHCKTCRDIKTKKNLEKASGIDDETAPTCDCYPVELSGVLCPHKEAK